jgi:hypothetical protein
MKPFFEQIASLLGEFKSYTVRYIPSEQNKEADALSNRAQAPYLGLRGVYLSLLYLLAFWNTCVK